MEYLLLVHKNRETVPTENEWTEFIEKAIASGMFQGGSELGSSSVIGKEGVPICSDHIGGFMRFNATNLAELKSILSGHPVVKNGGSIELIEMSKTS